MFGLKDGSAAIAVRCTCHALERRRAKFHAAAVSPWSALIDFKPVEPLKGKWFSTEIEVWD